MLPIVDLPLNPGEKYALIAVNGATDISEVIDLGNGLFELPGGGFRLPEHWREWIGSVESEQIETRTGLLLLAKRASDRPEVLDAENQQLQRQTQWLYWGLLATGRFWIQGGATQVTGTYSEGQVSVAQKGRMLDVFNIQGLQPVRIGEADLRRAARLAGNLGDLMVRRGMRRVKLALRTFWSAFEEKDLGQRIHQFVRVASEGFAKSFGHREFIERSRVFVGKGWMVECGQLYRMRNNAEHFNLPDSKLKRLPRRASLERAYLRALQAEAIARHCVQRFVADKRLWKHFHNDLRVDAFWRKPRPDCTQLWGRALDLEAAVGGFNSTHIPDEET